MQEPVHIVVVVEGGIVQFVGTAGVPVRVTLIDYDIEGGDPADETFVPQGPGMNPCAAYVSRYDADTAEAHLAAFMLEG